MSRGRKIASVDLKSPGLNTQFTHATTTSFVFTDMFQGRMVFHRNRYQYMVFPASMCNNSTDDVINEVTCIDNISFNQINIISSLEMGF